MGLTKTAATTSTNVATTASTTKVIPKGRNISGRVWKNRDQKRATSLITTEINNRTTTWEQKMAAKNAKQLARELEQELKQRKKEEIAATKQRRLENEQRRAANEYKAIQSASQSLNPNKLSTKLKAMSKKQLRQIKKTQINTKTGVVEYVPVYGNNGTATNAGSTKVAPLSKKSKK